MDFFFQQNLKNPEQWGSEQDMKIANILINVQSD